MKYTTIDESNFEKKLTKKEFITLMDQPATQTYLRQLSQPPIDSENLEQKATLDIFFEQDSEKIQALQRKLTTEESLNPDLKQTLEMLFQDYVLEDTDWLLKKKTELTEMALRATSQFNENGPIVLH